MNIPNTLTVSRIVLTFAFLFFLYANGLGAKIAAIALFAAASLTDLLDGYLAKRMNQITDFGRLMDPIADKILILAAFLSFVEMGIMPAWMVLVIIFRELAVTGLRLFALSQKRVIPADRGGKHKTVWQVFAIFLVLFFIMFNAGGPGTFRFWTGKTALIYTTVIYYAMAVTVLLTLMSGMAYLIKNKELYSYAKPRQ